MGTGKVQIPTQVVNVLSMEMTKDTIQYDKDWNNGCTRLAREDHKHSIRHDAGNELMNPLHAKSKLKQKGTQKERKDMTHSSIRDHVHDHTQRITEKETKSVVQRLHVETNGIRELLNIVFDNARYCETDAREKVRSRVEIKKDAPCTIRHALQKHMSFHSRQVLTVRYLPTEDYGRSDERLETVNGLEGRVQNIGNSFGKGNVQHDDEESLSKNANRLQRKVLCLT